MKKIINAVAGDGKLTPAKKYTAYVAMITAALFALVLVILIVSSVVFAVTDGGTNDTPLGNTPSGDNASDDGNVGVSSNAVQYETVSSDKLKEMFGDLVDFKSMSDRAIDGSSSNRYYGKTEESIKLSSNAMNSLHKMMIDFYNANKDTIKPDTKSSDCNIPLITSADASGYSFKIVDYSEKSIYNNSIYKWIYTNANSYGFIYNENSFTYVGTTVSTYMKNKNITDISKLITSLNGKTVSVSITTAGATKATTYQIYYLSAGGELKVPTNYGFDVIPNGSNGYFVIINTANKKSS